MAKVSTRTPPLISLYFCQKAATLTMGLASGQFLTSISNDMSCPLHPTVGTTLTVGFLRTRARALCTSWQG